MDYELLGIQGPRGASMGAAWGRQKGWFHTTILISEIKGQKLQLQKARASGLPLDAWAACFGESSSKGLVHGSQQSPELHLAAQVTVPPSQLPAGSDAEAAAQRQLSVQPLLPSTPRTVWNRTGRGFLDEQKPPSCHLSKLLTNTFRSCVRWHHVTVPFS